MAALVAIALAIALGIGVPHPALVERSAAAAFGLLGLGAGSIALSTAVDSGRAASSRRRELLEEAADAGTAGLAALERSIRFGASTAGDFYGQLRPRLVSLAKARLSRYGVALSDRKRVEELLGRDAYVIVDPECPPPVDRFAPGVPLCQLPRTARQTRGFRGGLVTDTVGGAAARLSVADIARMAEEVVTEVEQAVVGKREAILLVLIGVLAGGHVLLEDVPGLAKTLIVRSLARVLGLETSRIQFTPDLMPADVTGSGVFDHARGELVFRPGPVFANLVLGDEINRAPPKTQAALLEAMQEQQVTVDGITHLLPSPFVVVATQNPIEYEGTYPLPEAQLDRFLLRVSVGYPDRDAEWDVIRRRATRGHEEVDLTQISDARTVLAMREAIERVEISEPVGRYLVDVVRTTRSLAGIEIGASPRGALALLLSTRARAAIAGRDFVLPDDIKALAVACLAHRLTLLPDLWLRGSRPEELVVKCLELVPVPVAEER